MINFDDFKKLEMRVGKINTAAKVEKSDKLLVLEVDMGEEKRQIVSGIAEFYQPEDLIGMLVVVLVNLEPRKIMGLQSEGMILAAEQGDEVALITPGKEIAPGARIT